MKFENITELYDYLPESERLLVDVLRRFVISVLPENCNEKISFNVPFFYRKKGICIIWPAAVKGGGVKEGVLFGFWQGNKLNDPNYYLKKGTNKKVFYKIFKSVHDINFKELEKLLRQAAELDTE